MTNPFAPTTDNPFAPKVPFAATSLGIATNTVLGLPRAALGVGKDILQGVARSVGSTALTLAKPLGGVDQLDDEDIQNPFRQTLFRTFFGKEPIKPIEDRIAEAELAIKNSPFAQRFGLDQAALPLAFGGVFGSTALDLTPFGSLEKNATKALLRETTEAGAKKILSSMRVPDDIAREFAPHFASANAPEIVDDIFDNMKATIGVQFARDKELLSNAKLELSFIQDSMQGHPGKGAGKYLNWRTDEFKKGADAKFMDDIGYEASGGGDLNVLEEQRAAYQLLVSREKELKTQIKTLSSSLTDRSKGVVKGNARATLANIEQKSGVKPVTDIDSIKQKVLDFVPQTDADRELLRRASGETATYDAIGSFSVNGNRRVSQFLSRYDELNGMKPATNVADEIAPQAAKQIGEGAPAAAKADQVRASLPETVRATTPSLETIVAKRAESVKDKVNALDYFRTPDRVLEKIGFGNESRMVREGYEAYVKELPKNIDKITAWSKEVPASSAKTIFQYLDGEKVQLTAAEAKVAGEMKEWLKDWAKRLKLPGSNTITNYITHIFDEDLIKKEFDEDLAKIITDKIPGSVYDPFVLKRLGAKGYKQNVFEALDAYVKRATRKVNMDDALDAIQRKAGSSLEMSNIEASQWKYLQRYVSGVNMRPTELDNLIDNTVKSAVGYRYGNRPVTHLTKTLRRMTYRGMLGLNPGSALRNISQGINTYATLGEKYTAIGYASLLRRGAMQELAEEGVFAPGFIQDRTLSSTKKAMERVDKGLFAFFEAAERINRGSAYFGAKSKALAEGKSPQEAVDYAKSIVRKTQFSFGSIDIPVAVQSDIVKTIAQFQNYTLKQTEFLAEMVKDKNFVGMLRYAAAGTAFVYTIGQAFGMEPKDLIPSYRFGVPPSLKFPYEVGKAALNAPDKYGRTRTPQKKASDIAKSGVGLIPGGTQAKKSIEGAVAYNQGKDTTPTGRTRFEIPQTTENFLQAILFGKYSLSEADAYFDKLEAPAGSSSSSGSNPF